MENWSKKVEKSIVMSAFKKMKTILKKISSTTRNTLINDAIAAFVNQEGYFGLQYNRSVVVKSLFSFQKFHDCVH